MASQITQRGATGYLPLSANGEFQVFTPQSGLPAGYTDTTLTSVLGTRWDLDDGREVVLVQAGAVALPEGVLVQDAPLIANHSDLAVTAFSAYSNNGNSPATVTVTLGATAATLNQYQRGQAMVVDGTGKGQSLRIASHLAAVANAALVLTLGDGPNTALDTTSKISLVPAYGLNAVIYPHAAMTNVLRGVTLYPIAAGSSGYVLSKGTISCLADATAPSALEPIAPSTTVDGAIGQVALSGSVVTTAPIGYAIYATVSAKYYPVAVDL